MNLYVFRRFIFHSFASSSTGHVSMKRKIVKNDFLKKNDVYYMHHTKQKSFQIRNNLYSLAIIWKSNVQPIRIYALLISYAVLCCAVLCCVHGCFFFYIYRCVVVCGVHLKHKHQFILEEITYKNRDDIYIYVYILKKKNDLANEYVSTFQPRIVRYNFLYFLFSNRMYYIHR